MTARYAAAPSASYTAPFTSWRVMSRPGRAPPAPGAAPSPACSRADEVRRRQRCGAARVRRVRRIGDELCHDAHRAADLTGGCINDVELAVAVAAKLDDGAVTEGGCQLVGVVRWRG